MKHWWWLNLFSWFYLFIFPNLVHAQSAPIIQNLTVDNQQVTVEFSNPNALVNDWVGLYPQGTSPGQNALAWKWLNNTQTKTTQPVMQGQITFDNLFGGVYEIWYLTPDSSLSWPWRILDRQEYTSPSPLYSSTVITDYSWNSLFANHQQKLQTIGNWTYTLVSRSPLNGTSTTPLKWSIYKTQDGTNWVLAYDWNFFATHYQEPLLLRVGAHLGVIFAGVGSQDLYYQRLDVDSQTGNLSRIAGEVRFFTGPVSYFGADADANGNILVMFFQYQNETLQSIARVNGTWQAVRTIATKNPTTNFIALYPNLV